MSVTEALGYKKALEVAKKKVVTQYDPRWVEIREDAP